MSAAGGPLALVLDVGTSQLKAALVGPDGLFCASSAETWHYRPLPGVPGGLTFAPEALLQAFVRLSSALWQKAGAQAAGRVCTAIVSSQRLGAVLLRADGTVLEGIPNIDRRAARAAAPLADPRYEAYYRLCGRWPGPQHMLGRLRWFAAQGQRDAIAKILSLSDWLTWQLCGCMASEPTTACETACLDIATGCWSQAILEQEGLPRALFPPLVAAGTPLGRTQGAWAQALGLPEGIPVCAGAGDTGLGLLGTGALRQGQQAVVAGSSAPVNQVLAAPLVDQACRTITNPYAVRGMWVMEANAMMTGLSFAWAKDLLLEGSGPAGYAQLEALARHALATPAQLCTFAGASVADARHGNAYPMGQVRFAMADLNAGHAGRAELALSVFEAAAFAILANRELLARASGTTPAGPFRIGGGETRLPLLLELLQAGGAPDLQCVHGADLTCLGAAILAFTTVGVYAALPAACTAMVHIRPAPAPGRDVCEGWAPGAAARRQAWLQQLARLAGREGS